MEAVQKPRVALVTGAGRGIGKGIATRLARDGHHVICVSKTAESCGKAAEEIVAAGGRAEARAVDVGDGAAVAALCEALLAEHGSVDVLVNNAGITRDGLLFRMKDEDWHDVLTTNLSSCFYFCRALGRQMTRNRWGRILNVSSVVGLMGNAGQANYAAAKAGILGLSKSLAKEFGGRNVTVNVLAPGFIETDMTAVLPAEAKTALTKLIALKRIGTVEDLTGLAAFLCSEEAGYITGQVFTVDGGMVM